MASRRKRDSSYTTKRAAIRKALPNVKIPLPTSPANKSKITRWFLDLFGGTSPTGIKRFGLTKSSEGYSRNTFRTKKQAQKVARALATKSFGRTVITPPGRAKLTRDTLSIKRNGLTYFPLPINRRLMAEDLEAEADRLASKIGRNQRAQLFIGNHSIPRFFDRDTFAENFSDYVDKFSAKYPDAVSKLRVEIIQLSKQRKGSLDDAIAHYTQKQKKKNRGR